MMVLTLLLIGVLAFLYFLNSGVRAKQESSNKLDVVQLRKESQKESKQEKNNKKVEEETQEKKLYI